MMFTRILVAALAAAAPQWTPLNSQQAKQEQGQVVAPVPAPAAAPIAAPVMANAILRVGTVVPLRLSEELTTKGKKLRVGDRFHLETSEPVMIQGVNVIPVGSPAMGEITDARNKGMWGKSGHLAARILYVTVNGRQIRLSGAFDDKGVAGGVGAVAVSAIVFLPAGFFMTGRAPRSRPVRSSRVSSMRTCRWRCRLPRKGRWLWVVRRRRWWCSLRRYKYRQRVKRI